jgi:SPP1 family predicted phage head-tail adaptor
MAYASGLLRNRVIIANKMQAVDGDFGRNSGGVHYLRLGEFWAEVKFTKGMKAMHEGALDAYDTVMIRMRYNDFTTRDSLLIYDGITYQILSFHADKQENEIQITACELVQGAPAPAQQGGAVTK